MTVARLTRTGKDAGGACVVLPPDYVAADVDLGYATTTHRAQGITVDNAHVLAGPGMVRENLYVAMTRGRRDNHVDVDVAVDDVDPAGDYLPDTHATPDGHDVLAAILATSGAELSTTQTIAARQNAAASLKRLEPIRQTILADASAPRWAAALRRAGLSADQVDQITASPVCGPLFTALERGAAIDQPMDDVLAELIWSRPLSAPDEPARDIASLLHHHVTRWLNTLVEEPAAITTRPDVANLSPGARETLRQVDELIAARIDALTDHAITASPRWVAELGPEPDDDHARQAWRRQVAAVVAHEDFTNGPTVVPSPLRSAVVLPPPAPNSDLEALRELVWSEGPHIFRRDGYYYLVTAEGGTEARHSTVVARSRAISGPYEGCPRNPVLTHRNMRDFARENVLRILGSVVTIQVLGVSFVTVGAAGSTFGTCLLRR